jgi:glutamate/tyrosine decarboxylase-like PLP-dependent enzyme
MVFTNWPAGMYGTPSISGTRPGGALASAWAVMRYLGRKGFIERTRQIFDVRDAIIMGLRDLGAETIGSPDCYHFNFTMPEIDNLVLADQLTKDGWIVSSTESPKTVQLMITAAHGPSAQPLVQAVKEISADIQAGRRDSTGAGSVYSKVVVKPRIAKGAAARA